MENKGYIREDIYESMLEQHGGVAEEARKSAAWYGWTETNKKFFSRLLFVYDDEMDMTVAWEKKWCRFTNKRI